MFKRLLSYYKPYKKLLFLDLFCALLLAAFDLVYPEVSGRIADVYVPQRQLRPIVYCLLLLLGLYILKAGMRYVVSYYGHIMGTRMTVDMRRQVFGKLEGLPLSYFDNHKTGVIMSRIVNDLFDTTELFHHGPEELFIASILLIGSFVMLSRCSLALTLIIYAFIPLVAWASIVKNRKYKRARAENRKHVGEINADLESSITGIRVTKAFTGQEHEICRLNESNENFRRSQEFAYKAMAEYQTLINFMIDFIHLVSLGASAVFACLGKITVGEMVKYILYATVFANAMRRLIDLAEMYANGVTGFERFCNILDQESEKELSGAAEMPRVRGDIRLENVSFRYDDLDREGNVEQSGLVLSGISLDVRAGEEVAIVGPSGSGKTTLCHLLPRFYDITGGRITIDGTDIGSVTLQSLRRNIGIVQQDVFLFNGTIRENIAYGDFSADDARIEEAAKLASIHDFIMSLPDGYDTQVGERGTKLSGGQKQRVAIARVFLKDPPILILDEATSSLDNVTELAIQQSLDKLCRGRTTLVVAHRLSTVKNADEIVVLTPKGIEERGTHEALLAQGGVYAALYKLQFRISESAL